MEFLEVVPDYRIHRVSNYSMVFMLLALIVATIEGKTSVFQAVTWISVEIALLESMGIKFSNGVPSYDTFSRMLRKIDHESFAMEFVNWMNVILIPSGIHMSIDGKGLVGSTERIKGKRTPYVLNIVEASTGITIACIPIYEKTNEIKAIPEILAWVAICSNMITIDAIGTQVDIIHQILEENGDYLLLIKKNNPEAYTNLVAYFEKVRKEKELEEKASKRTEQAAGQQTAAQSKAILSFETILSGLSEGSWDMTGWIVEKNRERMEYRRCTVVYPEMVNGDVMAEILGASSMLSKLDIACAKTLGLYEAVRIPIEQDESGKDITPSLEEFLKQGSRNKPNPKTGDDEDSDIYRVGIISSRKLTANEVIMFKRRHWSVENKLHHVLDVTLREDMSSLKQGKFNCSLLRKISLNLIRMCLFYEEIADIGSIPAEGIRLAHNVKLMKKLFFERLPIIRVNSAYI